MILFAADDPLVLNGTYDQEGYKPGERARIAKARDRQTPQPPKRKDRLMFGPDTPLQLKGIYPRLETVDGETRKRVALEFFCQPFRQEMAKDLDVAHNLFTRADGEPIDETSGISIWPKGTAVWRRASSRRPTRMRRRSSRTSSTSPRPTHRTRGRAATTTTNRRHQRVQILKSRSEWLAARKTAIGASDVAAILGVSTWKGPLQLYHEKRGMVDTPQGETFARELGLALEDPIAALYAKRTRRIVVRPDPGTFHLEVHPRKPYMVATLDGRQVYNTDEEDADLRNRPGLVEIKTAAISKAALWTNEAPIDYQVQVQHQLAVTEQELATCVALIGGVSLVYSDIKRDNEFIAMLEAACEEFMRRVELGDPPPPDGTATTKAFLRSLYPDAKPISVTLPPEALDWDAAREQATADVKAATTRKLEAENKLLVAMGDATLGILPSGVLYTRKTVNRKGYVVQPTSYIDFRRKGVKGEKVATIAKGRAPSIDDVARVFEEQQQTEQETIDDGDITFD